MLPTTQNKIIAECKSWAIAIAVSLMIFIAMTTFSYAMDSTEVKTELKKVAGKGSWIQSLMAIGALASGVVMMYKNHLIAGAGTIAGVWGALGLYNSEKLF